MRGRVVFITLSILIVGTLSVFLALRSDAPRYHASVGGRLLISGGLALTPFGRHLVRKVVHNGKYVPEVHSRV